MVRGGKITQGMSMNAVHFAWGKPATITRETRNQQETTRWDYVRSKPTFNDPDAYTSYARAFADPTSSDQLTTPKRSSRALIPNRSATVWFVDGKVDEWERIR